jgi:hypothetical protein
MNAIKPDRLGEGDQTAAAAAEFEGEVREFVRRDISFRRRARLEGGDVPENAGVIDRISGAAIEEVERVMAELSTMRDVLRAEGERVQREVTNYAGMTQAAITSMKIIGDSLAQLKPPAGYPAKQIDHDVG